MTTTRGMPASTSYRPDVYWEERARLFADEGAGLAAVCSYGMPQFYNRMIHLSQYLALSPWLKVTPRMRVLDAGCGVGRWSRLLAARGAHVTGIDISPTMIRQAWLRTSDARLSRRCRFRVEDLTKFDLHERFDRILGVTVLQHILEPDALREALHRLTGHLAEGGRMILLEAAPLARDPRCDSAVFKARHRETYLQSFAECGLRVRAITGVDPAPFKIWLLPRLSKLPRLRAMAALAATTALSLPVDALFGRRAVARSWHAVFVLEHEPGARHAH